MQFVRRVAAHAVRCMHDTMAGDRARGAGGALRRQSPLFRILDTGRNEDHVHAILAIGILMVSRFDRYVHTYSGILG